MRAPLDELSSKAFDVAVIGAGVNGSSAAQHLAADGFRVLLVDKGDFASGSSSRSSRLLHCGLRYLAPGASAWEFVRHPQRFAVACRMARAAMQCRAQFVRTAPERVRPFTFCFPFYDNSTYSGWQIDAAFSLLKALGPSDVPLDYKRLNPKRAKTTPLVDLLRDQQRLRGVATFREYQFDWPERIVVDTVLDAERLGAHVRNYTSVVELAQRGSGWEIGLEDGLTNQRVTVKAKAVLNMAGIWIDRVGQRIQKKQPRRRITGTKGAHIVVQLPPECANYGLVTINRLNEPFYCVPWRGLHYFGPTETLYEGDPDDVYTTAGEIDWLLDEANYLLPGLGLKRSDVIYTWAGVRPLTYDPRQPKGARSRELHDYSLEGLENMFAMTAGPIMTHRSAGQEAVDTIKRNLDPSGTPAKLSYAARPLGMDSESPYLGSAETGFRLADVERAVTEEHAQTLTDILFRRLGAGWSASMGRELAEPVARILGKHRNWDAQRVDEEARAYLAYLEHQYPKA